MKMNDPVAHLRWLAYHPSLLVSGTAQGAIRAFEDRDAKIEMLLRRLDAVKAIVRADDNALDV